jgi:hypothetical protein
MKTLDSPKLSVLVPWCDREELQECLERNSGWIEQNEAEVLVLNCGGNLDNFKKSARGQERNWLRPIHIPRAAFNKCLALNIGTMMGHSPVVLALDADTILASDVVARSLSFLSGPAFVTTEWLHETVPNPAFKKVVSSLQGIEDQGLVDVRYNTYAEFLYKDGSVISHRTFRQSQLTANRAGAGVLFVKKEHLLEVGGYNSELELWGWEDNDIAIRLRTVLDLEHLEIGDAIHMSHSDSKRALNGLARMETSLQNLARLCPRYSMKNFQGTYAADTSAWASLLIEL